MPTYKTLLKATQNYAIFNTIWLLVGIGRLTVTSSALSNDIKIVLVRSRVSLLAKNKSTYMPFKRKSFDNDYEMTVSLPMPITCQIVCRLSHIAVTIWKRCVYAEVSNKMIMWTVSM